MLKVSTSLKTEFGSGQLHVYNFSEGNYLVFVFGIVEDEYSVLTRVHDQCATADILHSDRCDCRQQRLESLRQLGQTGKGVFIHTPLEGRAQGLLAKIQQYDIQSQMGLDTIEAAKHLGYSEDSRNYDKIPLILNDLSVKSIVILTDNPNKVSKLRNAGVQIAAVQGLNLTQLPEEANRYVEAKKKWSLGKFS